MTPLCLRRSPGFTSGTTSGVLGSMRKADELSTTTQPAALAAGTNSRLRVAPAEKKAMSQPLKASAFSSSTLYGLPLNSSVLPTERAEARSLREATGKFRRSRTRRISTPTAPVAPTMAMFWGFMVARKIPAGGAPLQWPDLLPEHQNDAPLTAEITPPLVAHPQP